MGKDIPWNSGQQPKCSEGVLCSMQYAFWYRPRRKTRCEASAIFIAKHNLPMAVGYWFGLLAKKMWCTTVPVAPPGGGKNTNYRFSRFFVRSVPLFRSLMLTAMLLIFDFWKPPLRPTLDTPLRHGRQPTWGKSISTRRLPFGCHFIANLPMKC